MTLPGSTSVFTSLLAALVLALAPVPGAAMDFRAPPGVAVPDEELRQWQAEFDRKKKGQGPTDRRQEATRGEPAYLNALVLESSPYLLQHADNPVNWMAWTQDSLARALDENKLIFLSIGYSTCHWCHVMNRESFSDPLIAELINRNFVAIKVDREEMPALDQYYSSILAMIKGSAGWPLTAILDASGKPVFVESYLDPAALRALLARVVDLAATQPALLDQNAQLLASLLDSGRSQLSDDSGPLTQQELTELIQSVLQRMDREYGGYQGAQKFPDESTLLFLLAVRPRLKSVPLQEAISLQLTKMATGGLYDPINGGFFRYSTDPYWRVPHYEKMLYNQALLLQAYSLARHHSDNPLYSWVIADLQGFLQGWMHAPGAGYYSAIDAESQGRQGFYYNWDSDSLGKLGAEDIERAGLAAYDAPAGEGLLGISMRRPDTTAADDIRKTLKHENRDRMPPFIDRKIITAWNAALLSGRTAAYDLAQDGTREKALAALEQQTSDLWSTMYSADEGALYRTWFGGRRIIRATLEDYAFLLRALLDLYDVAPREIWLQRARILAELILQEFLGEHGLFLPVGHEAAHLAVRHTPDFVDAELPAADAVALGALWRLAARTGDAKLKQKLLQPLAQLRRKFRSQPHSQLYAASVLAEIDLGAVSTRQYFASGHGKLTVSMDDKQGESCAAIAAKFKLEPGWHVNSASPLQDYLRPTSVSVETADKQAATVQFPEAHIVTLGFQKEALSVYEGDFTIRISSEDCKQWHRGAALSVQVQACTDRICLAPESLRVLLPGTVQSSE